MGDVNLDDSIEIGPGTFKRLGDCRGSEIESAIRLIARTRIDRAWIDEQASGSDQGRLTVGRRFFASVTEAQRDLIAYWQMVKLVEEEQLRQTNAEAARGNNASAARAEDRRGTNPLSGKRLIDQALAAVLATDSLGPGDQISLTQEQALVWAIYLRVIARHRGVASDAEVEHSVTAATNGGIPTEEIHAAIAAADRPGAQEEN